MRSVAVAMALFAVSGCAFSNGPTTQSISVDSDPPRATVTVVSGGGPVLTPGYLSLPRKQPAELRFEHEGYEPVVVKLYPQSGPRMTNFWAPTLARDSASGAIYAFVPNPVFVRLKPVGWIAPGDTQEVTFVNTSSASSDRYHGVIAVEVGGELVAVVPPKRRQSVLLPHGTHEVRLSRRKGEMRRSIYSLAVDGQVHFVEIWAGAFATKMKQVDAL